MIGLIDTKFIGLLSFRLRNFKQKTPGLYCFSCPICGDSSKNKLKARGYIFSGSNKTFYKCHNCLVSIPFAHFLRQVDQNMFQDYLREHLAGNRHEPTKVEQVKVVYKDLTKSIIDFLQPIESLSDSHPAVKYLISRRIPLKQWKRIYYTSKFKDLVELVDAEKAENLVNEPRIVFPFFNVVNQILAIQGRALSKKSLRYITIKVLDQPKIFGAETIDAKKRVYVTEGPIDSLFLDNCIAMAGADAKLPYKDVVLIYDNEKNSAPICKRMLKSINEGYSIFIWPTNEKSKDLNDWILSERCSPKHLQSLVDANTYSGLQAMLMYNYWKKSI